MFNDIKQAFMDGLDWLVGQLVSVFDMLWNFCIDLLNFGIMAFAKCIEFVVGFLPSTDPVPVQTIPDPEATATGLINFINWFLPVSSMAAVLAVVILNYVLYFTVGRLLKVIQVI